MSLSEGGKFTSFKAGFQNNHFHARTALGHDKKHETPLSIFPPERVTLFYKKLGARATYCRCEMAPNRRIFKLKEKRSPEPADGGSPWNFVAAFAEVHFEPDW